MKPEWSSRQRQGNEKGKDQLHITLLRSWSLRFSAINTKTEASEHQWTAFRTRTLSSIPFLPASLFHTTVRLPAHALNIPFQ